MVFIRAWFVLGRARLGFIELYINRSHLSDISVESKKNKMKYPNWKYIELCINIVIYPIREVKILTLFSEVSLVIIVKKKKKKALTDYSYTTHR